MSLNMDSTQYSSLQHPQSPTHRSPELAPISLTSMAESYERLHRNESTTAHQQQRQQMRTSLESPTKVYSSSNNNNNSSSHETTTKSHDASFTMTPSSSTSSISLFGSALSVGNEQENNSSINDQHTTEHTMVSNISRNTTSSGDDDPPCTTSYDDGGNPLTCGDEWHRYQCTPPDEVISQTKKDGDMDDKELEVDRFSIMDSGDQGIWQTYRPDYLMLNDSYQATKHNMYKEIEVSLGNLQQLESHVETSQFQLHGRIEEAYEAWSQQLDSQRRQLAHRHRAINDDHLDKHSLESGQVTFQTKIKLNVGGDIFETSLATLKKDRSSLLATMFSGKHTMQPDQEGAYFIDRDPTHFRLVLNYLRDLWISPSVIQDKLICQELLQEAEFYRIDGLVKLLV